MEVFIPEKHIVKVHDFHECMARLPEGSTEPTRLQREIKGQLAFKDRYSLTTEEEDFFDLLNPVQLKFWREIRIIDPRNPHLLVSPTIEFMEESGLATDKAIEEAAQSLEKVSEQESINSADFMGEYILDPDEIEGARRIEYLITLTSTPDKYRDVLLQTFANEDVYPYRIIMRRNTGTKVMFYKTLGLLTVIYWAMNYLKSSVESEEDNVFMQFIHHRMFSRRFSTEFSNPHSMEKAFSMINLPPFKGARDGLINFGRDLKKISVLDNPKSSTDSFLDYIY